MSDKDYMEELLMLEKGACDLFLHATIESSTANVHTAFCTALNDSLQMQNTIYAKMSAKGWYSEDQADQSKLSGAKQKFAVMV